MKYEKKYKEALERAKEINREHFKKGFGPSDDALYIFPELAEPKFKVGDWIIFNGLTLLIEEVVQGYYRTVSIGGIHNSYDWDIDNAARLWSIQEAKNGNVLAYNDGSLTIFHYRLIGLNAGLYMSHVLLTDKIEFKQTCAISNLHPATKEQRDLLFQKMKEVGYIWDYDKKELRKIVDNVKPKFHVGDWIISDAVDKDYHICKITGIKDGNYTIESTYGYKGHNQFDVFDNSYRLWTIKDAKDGDVLATLNYIYIFDSIDKETETVGYYCLMKKSDGHFSFGDYKIHDEILNSIPATKEQRDLLFQKMKEAGYEWDAEKKELKKIEEEVNGEDYGIDSLFHAQRILEKTLGKVDGYQSDDGILEHKCAISAVKKLYEKKPAWSEEDERMYRGIHNLIYSTPYCNSRKEFSDWLESLKGLVQPKQEWKQENTGELTDFENAMMYIGGSFFGQYAGLDPNDTNTIKKQANILLELVPSKEWSEEDKYNFSDIEDMIHTMRGDGRNADKLINWLKESIQPQTNITDEELAQAKKDAYNDALDKIEYRSGEPTFDDGWSAAIGYLKKRNTY